RVEHARVGEGARPEQSRLVGIPWHQALTGRGCREPFGHRLPRFGIGRQPAAGKRFLTAQLRAKKRLDVGSKEPTAAVATLKRWQSARERIVQANGERLLTRQWIMKWKRKLKAIPQGVGD